MKLVIALVTALMMAQSPQQEEPEEGKPARCDNFKGNAHPCACGRATHSKCNEPPPDVAMDAKCSTYCRKQNCHCLGSCTT